MTELQALFTPITLGKCEIKNRIIASGHMTGYTEDGLPSERHLRYYEARAKGGIGLIVNEAVAVNPHVPPITPVIQGWRDDIIPKFAKISDAIHAHGARYFAQLWHNGNESMSFYSGVYSQSCSDVPSIVGEVPTALSKTDIKQVIREYTDTALRLKEAGLDGVELHFGHGYLPQQFLSPVANIRKDEYGGSLENRMRFSLELIDSVRNAVGEDFVVGIRSSADELIPHGLTLENMKEIIPIWDKTGKIDYISATVCTYKSAMMGVPPMMVPPRPFVYTAAEIRQIVDVPVMAAIRINDPVMANEIVKNHEADMVIMARATICDPEMPNKAKQGRLDDIRQCISCNEGCWERIEKHAPITCAQNPESGREGVFVLHPADRPKKVLVVGGGVAGMKAATIAKERGHQVSLYEKTSELGGVLSIPASYASRADLGQVIRFLEHEVNRLGVDVHLDTEVTASMIEAKNPDAVIIATGGTAIDDPAPGVVGPAAAIQIEGGMNVVTAEDVLQGKVETGQRVVIADAQNYMKGLITAEYLADHGKDVSIVMNMSYLMDASTMAVQLINLTMKNVRRVIEFEVIKAEPGKITMRHMLSQMEEVIEADTLVLSFWRKANATLFNEIKDRVKEVYKIGDCVASRRYGDAIYEGYKTAMDL
jgi:2,4-dienoyl-CoA reductase-like NADH-dependent reductase (Old Yellow Enzyme family)/thioredoxin reductase